MFSKDDYRIYFESVNLQEREMVFRLHNLISQLKDEEIVRILKKVADDEVRHYALSGQMFEDLVSGQVDLRRWQREHCLGLAQLKNLTSHQVFECRCINYSQGGVGLDVEASHQVEYGNSFDIKIDFFDKRPSFSKMAIVRWNRRIRENLYTCGLEFY